MNEGIILIRCILDLVWSALFAVKKIFLWGF